MQYNKSMNKRKDTYSVEIGNIKIGSKHPIRVQSMTNTLTTNEKATIKQINALADEGVDVAICSRNIDDVNSALDALKGKGVNAIGGAVDVADGDALKTWIASTIGDLGGLDILVPQVSAGGGNPSEDGWAANFQTDIMLSLIHI